MSKVVVITGGIASGKSTVASFLASRGYPVIDADQLSRRVVVKGSQGLEQLVEHFSSEILTSRGDLDRRILGDKIFQDQEQREVVNKILHPLILEEIIQEIKKQKQTAVVFVDVPLYYEVGWDLKPEEVWLVYIPEAMQEERLQARNHITKEEAQQRIHSQMPIEDKKRLADRVIDNQGELIDTYRQVTEGLRALDV